VETEAQDISGYIPTNLISITDGQLYLSPRLFQKGILPAIDVGKSVSRVGGKAQLPAYRAVAGDVRISYSQFEELETFSRFGTRLDEATRKVLDRGWRLREILKQSQYKPIPVAEQVAAILAVTSGQFDSVAVEDIRAAEDSLRKNVAENQGGFCTRVRTGEKFGDKDRETIVCVAQETALCFQKEPDRADR
jgi:F-type H+-transporting ATPase subunit alpha